MNQPTFRTLSADEKAERRARRAARPVHKRTEAVKRDGRTLRRIVVTVYPQGTLGLRLEKCRREELLDVAAAYDRAVRERVVAERAAKKAARA